MRAITNETRCSTYTGLERFQLTGARLIASVTSWRRLRASRHVVTMTTEVNNDVTDRVIVITVASHDTRCCNNVMSTTQPPTLCLSRFDLTV